MKIKGYDKQLSSYKLEIDQLLDRATKQGVIESLIKPKFIKQINQYHYQNESTKPRSFH